MCYTLWALPKWCRLHPTKILDVGTGGGFPGIPLAILFPETNFYLVDSIQKKIGVVNAVAASVGLTNVKQLTNAPSKLMESLTLWFPVRSLKCQDLLNGYRIKLA